MPSSEADDSLSPLAGSYFDSPELLKFLSTVATPALVYSERQIRHNCALYQKAASNSAHDVRFRYAVKSCSLAPVLRTMASQGWGADCQSIMEMQLALEAGISPHSISLCSPRLSEADVRGALEAGVIIVADSLYQLHLLADEINRNRPRAGWHFGVRLSLDVPETERFHSKLGMELQDALNCLDELSVLRTHLNEVHHHGLAREHRRQVAGSIAATLGRALAELEAKLERKIEYVNFGGGLEPESILRSKHGVTTAEILCEVISAVSSAVSSGRTFVFEPGRAITKDAAVASTSVVNLKELRGANIAVVDVSTNLLIPLPLAEFEVSTISGMTGPACPYHVVDGTCSPAGVIARNAMLPPLVAGTRLLVHNAGAYTWSLAEPFYDYLPELWWADNEEQLHLCFSAPQSREWTRRVWAFN